MREKLTYLFVHQPIDNPTDPRVETRFLDYDANGNITHIEREINNPELPMDDSRESVQKLVWDEEDRLLGVDLRPESDRGQPHIAAYTYDAGGERGIRYVPRQQEGVSSGTTAGYAQDMDIMLYPNALITVRPQELPEDFDPMRMHPSFTFTTYTKHYYIGSERINSKLGTVKDLGVLCEQMGGNDLIGEMNRRVEKTGVRLEDLHTDLDKDLRLNSPYPYSREHQFVCDFKSHNEMYYAYWYHPDHLGSSSYITNTTGEISQHMEYLPFGETLVEEHLNSYNSPFRFNGKEFDAETGNYYYGARYMNPKWSTFLTPDPALESYPGISPYAYTLNNPVRYVDPTGMFVEGPDTDYKINSKGRIKRVDENDGSEKNKTDILFAIDNNGNVDRSKSIELDKGVIDSKKTETVITNKGPMIVDEYDILNDGRAKELFEFVHNNTNVEFSITGIGNEEGEKGNNKLTTSGKERGEAGAPKLLIEGYSIRYSIHGHHYSSNASTADKNFASKVNSKFPKASLGLFHKGNYIRYDSKGSIKPLRSNLKQISVKKLFIGL